MKMKEEKNIINDNFKLEQFRKIDNLTLRVVLQRGALSTIFKVFGMSWPQVDQNPRPPALRANTLPLHYIEHR